MDGRPVDHFGGGSTNSVQWRIIRSEGKTIAFTVLRNGHVLTINSGWEKPETASWRRPALRKVEIGPRATPGIRLIEPGSIAAGAGLKAGDLVLTANGHPIFNLDEILPLVDGNRGKSLSLTVDRAGQQVSTVLPIPPKTVGEESIPTLGIEWGRITYTHPSPWSQIDDAATSIFRMIGALLSPKSDVKITHFSGPVGILHLYYRIFEEGWRLALSWSVLINVDLALLNLLPFPVLDGGHIVLAIVESIRKKPINIGVLETLQTACAILLIGFMVYITFFDVGDFIPEKSHGMSERAGSGK